MSARSVLVTLTLLFATLVRASDRTVAVTFDDLPDITADQDSDDRQTVMTKRLLSAIARNHVPAVGFVNEDKLLDDNDRPDPSRVALLGRWLDSGCELGNHTFSHADLDKLEPEEYEQEILRGEQITRPLVLSRGGRLRWFRHPYLDTGSTIEVRDRIATFLAGHGYRVAPVTLINSEWIYDLAYRAAPVWKRPFIRRSYLAYMQKRFEWGEGRSRLVFGREIAQVLLLHASALNASAFDGLAALMRRRGYRFITLDEALADPACATPEAWTGGGVGWIERWGVTRGIGESEFEHDPRVPEWIQKLAGAKDE